MRCKAAGSPSPATFTTTVRRFRKRRRRVQRVALDSTGRECGHASRYYIRRRNGGTKQWQTVAYRRYAKLEAAFNGPSHLKVGVLVGRGSRPDVERFRPLLDDSRTRVRLGDALADAGYDSEPNQRYARAARSAVVHSRRHREAQRQAAARPLSATDEAALEQAFWAVR